MRQYSATSKLKTIMDKNKIVTSLIGKGFNNTITPSPLRRHVLENPKWYTPYSPYQAEISQGRLESLYYFQKMVTDITALPFSNASLLDIGSTSGEVVSMSNGFHKNKRKVYHASNKLYPYILNIIESKCEALGLELNVCDLNNISLNENTIGVMLQYPDTHGDVKIPFGLMDEAKEKKVIMSCATDLMALTKFKPPGEFGFDISFGSTQRFGIPLYYGGPHAAFISCSKDFLRFMPGRIVGKTKDSFGDDCFRLALQSREQHIRKEKATSNICTAQALLANMSSLYAIYHGNNGIKEIADDIHKKTEYLHNQLESMNFTIYNNKYFDTITISNAKACDIYLELKNNGYITYYNVDIDIFRLSISLDETISMTDINAIIDIMRNNIPLANLNFYSIMNRSNTIIYNNAVNNNNGKLSSLMRESEYLKDPIFNWCNRDETKFTRYVNKLCDKDYGLTHGMVPLGSCTMKLNAAYQLEPLSWESVANVHPFLPISHVAGYQELIDTVGKDLKRITGFDHVSFQSNSGAMGEYSALLCIKKYHKGEKKSVLIPESAHGTNFSSASLAGLNVIQFKDSLFDSLDIFEEFVESKKDDLAAMMITYPNTSGMFQKDIESICDIIHKYGGIVYLDGANMNALAGIVKPSDIGADVCHLNLHKTFCIPHGGGGPGMGPIFCNDKLAPFLPTHPFQYPRLENNIDSIGTISASQWSSASLLTIPYLYFREKGTHGIKQATQLAINNANYMKNELEKDYTILNGNIAHEFIVDVSEFKNVNEVDICKRLIDYSFHPPTMSWPRKGALMIEPTESESKEEMDRFIHAMRLIRKEIEETPEILKNAPHPIKLVSTEWNYNYSMNQAFYPLPHLKYDKLWPSTTRVDDVYGDKLMYSP